MQYLFFLGRQQDLAQAELEVVLARFQGETPVSLYTLGIVSAELKEPAKVVELMYTLGGTVKIAKLLEEVPTIETEQIEQKLIEYIGAGDTGRRTFAIAEHSRNHLDAVAPQVIKKALVGKGLSARYVEVSRSGAEAGLLLEGDITEYYVIHLGDKTALAQTVAVQDVHNWSKRDMDKPYRDKKKGMLPPKLARVMVNLAIGAKDPQETRVYDPFCGSGTVLMEALLLGTQVAGSDLDREAIAGAGKNLHWLHEHYSTHEDIRLTVQDVSQVGIQETGGKVDCIVTEPFLGKPNPLPGSVDNMLKGLEKLYLGALKQWKTVLKPGGMLVITFPMVGDGKRVKTVQTLIDRMESLGYTREKGPYIYTKLHAITQRAVYVYRLKE